jgi:uncharacterized ion transporter superfamily protein YfcC
MFPGDPQQKGHIDVCPADDHSDMLSQLLELPGPQGSDTHCTAALNNQMMAPLADLVGLSRQVAVLAFQFGDGFSNILVPTQAVIVGALALAGVPYDRWLRFILPFMVKIWIVGSIAMTVAVLIGYA